MTNEENAADIKISANGVTITVDQLQVNEEVDIQKRYGSGYNHPSGRSMGHIDVTGSFTIKGIGTDALNSVFYGVFGRPKEFDAITITHKNGKSTDIKDCIVTNRGYEVSDGDMTETSYEFDAMAIRHPFQSDNIAADA